MKKINKLILITNTIFVLFLSSCNSFDDINTNPDTSTEVSASLLCTNIILRVTQFDGRDAKALISENALPKYVGYANEGQLSTQYNSIGSSSFGVMTLLPNIENLLKYAQGSPLEDSYKGVAKFARAMMFYKLTMEMGDIPYSETNKGDVGIYKPKYDSQESVFVNILNELKEADQFFAKGSTFTGDPTPYQGNPEKWRGAVNAFTLKVLMSLSNKENVASLNVKNRFAEVVNTNKLIKKTEDFYGLVYSTQSKHPLSGTNDLFTSKTILSSLLVDNLKKYNDKRLFYFAEPAKALISAGKSESEMDAYLGIDVSIDYATMNAEHNNNKYSLINFRYLKEDACEPRMLLTYAEQQLILAEARIKGWITTGSAKTYYEEGVKSALSAVMSTKASYAHSQPITQNYIDNYFTGEAAFKNTATEQIEQIWMQRYILNFMQDAQTSYFEYRRNKFPVFPINPNSSLNENNKNGVPMRWLYPGTETSSNRENLEEALNRQYEGYDEINKLMWLLK